MSQIQFKIATSVGVIYVVASDEGLEGVYFQRQPVPLVRAVRSKSTAEKIILQAAKQITEYFSGKRKRFDLDLRFTGTAFQQQVWRQLIKIPYGKTASYRDIAKRIKNPKAVRAVGSANGQNPFCIIVPCHRVVAADGTIGGYRGGIARKRKLLQLEGHQQF